MITKSITKIRTSQDSALTICDYRISQILYNHFEGRSVFTVIYRMNNESYVNGIETELDSDQIIRNQSFIASIVSDKIKEMKKSEELLTIRQIVKELNKSIEEEILKNEE